MLADGAHMDMLTQGAVCIKRPGCLHSTRLVSFGLEARDYVETKRQPDLLLSAHVNASG